MNLINNNVIMTQSQMNELGFGISKLFIIDSMRISVRMDYMRDQYAVDIRLQMMHLDIHLSDALHVSSEFATRSYIYENDFFNIMKEYVDTGYLSESFHKEYLIRMLLEHETTNKVFSRWEYVGISAKEGYELLNLGVVPDAWKP